MIRIILCFLERQIIKMKKRTAHQQNRFLNCLRIAVVPEYHEEQRINSIVEFCKNHKFDNVMLFINSEEYNLGHMTKEEAKPWLEAMKRAKQALVSENITVSLNPWIEFGHLDRGRKLKPGQDFVTMTDYNGKACDLVACPMDENWLNYFLDFYSYIIKEIEPEVVWIEDDFRLNNHDPLTYGGCFCEHHMKAFNEELGTNYSREEFTDLLFRKNPNENVKKAFLEVNRRTMVELASKIGTAVKEIGLGTKIGLMSSMHNTHCMEYRDWNGIHQGFAQGNVKINRLHLPMYLEEVSMKLYYQRFNQQPFLCRGYLPEDCHVVPELENAVFSTYSKDPEALRFQVESAVPLEIEGMTYDIFDFAGNGAIEQFGYGQAVSGITEYLTAVANSGYSYHKLSGITIPLDEKGAYNRPITDALENMMPDDCYLGALLQGNGISARTSKDKEIKNEVVVLGAGAAYNYTDEQLCFLFENNRVILDGRTVELLLERELGYLIGASSTKSFVYNTGGHSYEQIEGDALVNGIPGYRASAFMATGTYISVTYDIQPEIKSRVFDYMGNEVGYGYVVARGHLVIPYVVDELYCNHMHPLRQKLICDYIDSLQKDFVRADYSSVYAYYSKGEEDVLILVNATLHSLPNTRFKMTGRSLTDVYEIDRDGQRRKVKFTLDEEGFCVVDERHEFLTTKTFILV